MVDIENRYMNPAAEKVIAVATLVILVITTVLYVLNPDPAESPAYVLIIPILVLVMCILTFILMWSVLGGDEFENTHA